MFRCDRVLWHGGGLRQLSYVRGESRFSDHRPVYSMFWAEVESYQGRLRKSMSYSSSRIQVEELLPYSQGYTELCFFWGMWRADNCHVWVCFLSLSANLHFSTCFHVLCYIFMFPFLTISFDSAFEGLYINDGDMSLASNFFVYRIGKFFFDKYIFGILWISSIIGLPITEWFI